MLGAITLFLLTVVIVNIFQNPCSDGRDAASAQVRNFDRSISSFRQQNGRYPLSLDELLPFLDSGEIPKDPWGNDYQMILSNDDVLEIVSFAADGKSGGEDENEDISSLNLDETR